jgi:hypothetical protein
MTLGELTRLTGKTEAELRAWTGGLKVKIDKKPSPARIIQDAVGEVVTYLDEDKKTRCKRLDDLKPEDVLQ